MAVRYKPIRIHFEDRGQTWLWWELDPPTTRVTHWKVVRCNADGWMFVESHVARGSIGVGKRPVLVYQIARTSQPVAVPVIRIEAIDTPKVKAGRLGAAASHEAKRLSAALEIA